MDKQDFLQSLGFNEYESKALSSLIKLQSASPKEISQDSSVPQNKLYQIIKNFEKLGIVALIPDKTKRYELINFNSFISNKIKEKEKQLK